MKKVVHFEMPYEDRERMMQFYQTNFGWEYNVLGEEMGNYVVAMTTESDQQGPLKPGAINGGFFPKTADSPMSGPSVVIEVDDIAASVASVSASGGKILCETMPIPGVGKYVIFEDPEGNRLSMLEPESV